MSLLRTLLRRHRAIALLVAFAALSMKIVLPAGFMPAAGAKTFAIQICADAVGTDAPPALVIPMKHDGAPKGGQGDGACAFASLAMSTVSATPPLLLAIALAFILALGFAPAARPLPDRAIHLRPPLRGQPALA
ncbi:MAG: hypothetical protein INF91_07790 [Alphaproteobacteria bacterium]|nr:hypothetical protein [Alphaproteobacteria bacterium]